jgi:hypothetical protein
MRPGESEVTSEQYVYDGPTAVYPPRRPRRPSCPAEDLVSDLAHDGLSLGDFASLDDLLRFLHDEDACDGAIEAAHDVWNT